VAEVGPLQCFPHGLPLRWDRVRDENAPSLEIDVTAHGDRVDDRTAAGIVALASPVLRWWIGVPLSHIE